MQALSPFVYWAQNETNVYLKVDLKDVKDPSINLEKRKLQFKSIGSGAHGQKNYEFSLDFYAEFVVNTSNYKVHDSKVNFTLVKEKPLWWPRLTSQPSKPAWLKIDFERWQSEDDIGDEDVRDVMEDYPNLFEKLQKEEIGYRKENFKKVYLTFYNLFMFIGFLYIVCVLIISYAKDDVKFIQETYKTLGPMMCFLQLLQFLEVMHPIFGYVKGSPLMPFMQIAGRAFILFAILEQEARIQVMPVVFYLFVVWSGIEVIRYPYYISQLYKKDIGLLTWLRYTAWIPLYPLGFLCESVIVFRNLIFVEQSGKWSATLPNKLNFTFHFPTVLRIYILFIMFPAMYTLITHMNRTRKQKLNKKKSNIIKTN